MKARVGLLIAGMLLSLFAVPASAETFPARAVTWVVPFPPAGFADSSVRVIAKALSEKLGKPVIVDNRPGAAEAVGASATASAPADGYTLMLATLSSLAVNPALYKGSLTYNPNKDFKPIVHIASVPAIMTVNPKIPANTLAELTAYFKSHPENTYASPGVGSPGHLGMEMYKQNAGVDVLHVPYRGGAPALQDLVSGQVDAMLVLVPEGMPFVQAGRIKALGISTLERSAQYPDLPTMDEAGLKDFEIFLWYTLVAPKATPDDVVDKLNQAVNAALKDDEILAKLKELSIDPAGGTPAEAQALSEQESIKWKKLIDSRGITAQ